MQRRIAIAVALLLVLLTSAGAFAFMHGRALKDVPAPPVSPPVPIVAGMVDQHDVPIYLTGVGTVIASNTDVVRSQILGQLVSINFTEGQKVHVGDLLAQIDPRPYQALIDEYVANRDRDQAHLANARKDLARYSGLAAGPNRSSWPIVSRRGSPNSRP